MSIYRNTMRRLRRYTEDVDKNEQSRKAAISKIDRKKFSQSYVESEEQRINEAAKQKHIQLAEVVKADLIGNLTAMRRNIHARLTKAPTADQINLLAGLRNLDDLSMLEVRLYADVMKDCPLALRQLKQIAATHHYSMSVPNADELIAVVDRLEDRAATFIQGYTGDPDTIFSIPVREMHQYLTNDDSTIGATEYKTLDAADRAFWDKFIMSPAFRETPDLLDSSDQNAAPTVQYYFHTVDDLSAFLAEAKEDAPEGTESAVENAVLSNSPEHYGAALRCYRATGEKLPLNSTVDTEG